MGFANEARGLAVAGTDFTYLSEGAYSVVFIDRAAVRIIKVFKRRPDEDHVRAVFKAEADAYGLAASSAEVSEVVPGAFRLCPVEQLIDKQGQDVTCEFFPDLAFETDFVEGDFYKIGVIGSAEASRVRRLFREAGIHHTSDMSVIISVDGIILKAIDFAVEEHELIHGE
jgi:hypothetical protein